MTTEEWNEILSNGSVWGCGHDERPPHTCPFKTDMNDDYDTLCTCCRDCTHECAMDI